MISLKPIFLFIRMRDLYSSLQWPPCWLPSPARKAWTKSPCSAQVTAPRFDICFIRSLSAIDSSSTPDIPTFPTTCRHVLSAYAGELVTVGSFVLKLQIRTILPQFLSEVCDSKVRRWPFSQNESFQLHCLGSMLVTDVLIWFLRFCADEQFTPDYSLSWCFVAGR